MGSPRPPRVPDQGCPVGTRGPRSPVSRAGCFLAAAFKKSEREAGSIFVTVFYSTSSIQNVLFQPVVTVKHFPEIFYISFYVLSLGSGVCVCSH